MSRRSDVRLFRREPARLVPQCEAVKGGVRCVRNIAHAGRHNPGRPGWSDWDASEDDDLVAGIRAWVAGLSREQAEAAGSVAILMSAQPELGQLFRAALLERQGFKVAAPAPMLRGRASRC